MTPTTPTLESLRQHPDTIAELHARARQARSQAMYSLAVQLLSRLPKLFRADESLGRPQHLGRAQWG